MALPQPVLKAEKGVLLVVGIRDNVNNTLAELVMPFATDHAIGQQDGAESAVRAFETQAIPDLQACISEDAEVVFLEASAMVHNTLIPSRHDYAAGTYPGTRAAGTVPSQVAGLGVYYSDGSVPTPHNRLQVGKDYIPCISIVDVVANILSGALKTAIGVFVDSVAQGIVDAVGGPATWYRVVAARHTAGITLPPVLTTFSRDVIATQRRRLRPGV